MALEPGILGNESVVHWVFMSTYGPGASQEGNQVRRTAKPGYKLDDRDLTPRKTGPTAPAGVRARSTKSQGARRVGRLAHGVKAVMEATDASTSWSNLMHRDLNGNTREPRDFHVDTPEESPQHPPTRTRDRGREAGPSAWARQIDERREEQTPLDYFMKACEGEEVFEMILEVDDYKKFLEFGADAKQLMTTEEMNFKNLAQEHCKLVQESMERKLREVF